jgi:hypothetical protein
MNQSPYIHRCIDRHDNMTKEELDDMRDVLINFSKPKTIVDNSSIVNAITEYNQLIDEITNIIKYDLPINYVDYNNRDIMIGDINSKFSIFDIPELKKYIVTLKQLCV